MSDRSRADNFQISKAIALWNCLDNLPAVPGIGSLHRSLDPFKGGRPSTQHILSCMASCSLTRSTWSMSTMASPLRLNFELHTVVLCAMANGEDVQLSFEGVCLTHVILAPGACGREGQSAGSGTISSGSAG